METRKLQQVGGGTFTVSIPKEWADDHALEAGMELHLYNHTDGSIVLRPSERDGGELGETTLAVGGEDPASVARTLRAAHAVGFETVTLDPAESFTDEQCRAARETVRTLVGANLLAASEGEITVQHLLDAGSVSVRQSVVQLQFTACSVHRQAVAAVRDGDADAADRLRERGEEATRLARMVERHVARSLVSFDEVDRLGVSRPALFDCFVVARSLEGVTRRGLELAAAARESPVGLPDPVATEVEPAAERARETVEAATTAVLDGATAADAQRVLDDCAEVRATGDAVERALFESDAATPAAAAAGARAVDAVRHTADRAERIAATALGAATRTDPADDDPE